MGKKREHKTEAELRKQVEEEIPYVVGKGNDCIQRRSKRLKELFRRYGYSIDIAPSGFGSFPGAKANGAPSLVGERNSGGYQTETGENAMPSLTTTPRYRGQRLA